MLCQTQQTHAAYPTDPVDLMRWLTTVADTMVPAPRPIGVKNTRLPHTYLISLATFEELVRLHGTLMWYADAGAIRSVCKPSRSMVRNFLSG